MKLFLISLFSVGIGLSQTWTDLGASTKLNTVTPQNCTNTGSPAYCNGVTFAYADNAASVMTAWSTAAARTKAGSEQLLIFGGGHVATFDNAVYAVNLNVSPATVTALTSPSIPTGSGSPVTTANITCVAPNADGTPLSQHTYGMWVYLPVADKVFFWAEGAGNYCATAGSRHTWQFNPTAYTWSDMSPSGYDVTAGSDAQYSFCVLDNSFAVTSDETVICEWGNNNMLLRYNATTNAWSKLTNFSSAVFPQSGTLAIDPRRKIMVQIGNSAFDGSGTQMIVKVDISNSSYTVTDLSSTLKGCSAINVTYPGVQWDSASGNFLVYTGTGNNLYMYNPDTGVCAKQTATGGPVAVNGTGTFGRFAYFPTLNKYVAAATVSTDVFTFQLPTGSGGLGSSTFTCVDQDGDGYGTGSSCTGADADDQDSTVHTGAQLVTKWSTLAGGLNHLGYNPTNIYYLSTSGTDAGSPPTCKNTIASPCKTFAYIVGSLAPNDMVIWRSGTFDEGGRIAGSPSGTAQNPIIFMAYPGETVTIDTTATSAAPASVEDNSWITIDGFRLTKGLNGGCITGGTSPGGGSISANTFHNINVRHNEAYTCYQGIIAAGLDNVLIEYNSFHNNSVSGGQHGIYLGARFNFLSSNIDVRRNLIYNNGYTGVQFNGNVATSYMEQNISYGNLIANYSWENGVHNSYFLGNLAMSWGGSGGFVISNYNGNEGSSVCGAGQNATCTCGVSPNLYATCAHDQINNLIENSTFYGTANDSDGNSVVNAPAINVALQNRSTSCTTTQCLASNLGSNTFRNLIVSSNTDGSNHYQPIIYNDGDKTYLATSTFTDVVAYQNDAGHSSGVIGFGANVSFGWDNYTCSTAIPVTTISGCTNGNPLFTAANPTWYNSISSFNFNLQSASPAKATGTTTGIPNFDLVGSIYNTSPSMGAYEALAACTLTPTSLPSGLVGSAYSQTISTTLCSSSTFTISSGSLTACTGLSIGSGTGIISGTPSLATTCTFTVAYDTGTDPLSILILPSIGGTGTGGNRKKGGPKTRK